MLDLYYNGKIKVRNEIKDNLGAIITVDEQIYDARIEDENRLIQNAEGEEVYSNSFVMTDPGIDIDYTSKVYLLEKDGIPHPLASKKLAIMKLLPISSFIANHTEIIL